MFALGCSDDKSVNFNEHSTIKKEIRIGTSVGDFADMVRDVIKPELEKKGYLVTLSEITDGVILNQALSDGSLDRSKCFST